jgi:hypothetical protein
MNLAARVRHEQTRRSFCHNLLVETFCGRPGKASDSYKQKLNGLERETVLPGGVSCTQEKSSESEKSAETSRDESYKIPSGVPTSERGCPREVWSSVVSQGRKRPADKSVLLTSIVLPQFHINQRASDLNSAWPTYILLPSALIKAERREY